jgi:hypothetical protein
VHPAIAVNNVQDFDVGSLSDWIGWRGVCGVGNTTFSVAVAGAVVVAVAVAILAQAFV